MWESSAIGQRLLPICRGLLPNLTASQTLQLSWQRRKKTKIFDWNFVQDVKQTEIKIKTWLICGRIRYCTAQGSGGVPGGTAKEQIRETSAIKAAATCQHRQMKYPKGVMLNRAASPTL